MPFTIETNSSRYSCSDASSYDNTTDSTEQQPPLFRLVKRSKWGKLRFALQNIDSTICPEHFMDETGLTLLGVALGFHAPLDIIKNIIQSDRSQVEEVDMFGANSLHLACLNGSSPSSVDFILKEFKNLESAKDRDGRVPLHHAVECICRDEIDFAEGMKVVQLLCNANPILIYACDFNNNSPSDLVYEAMFKAAPKRGDCQARNLKNLSRTLRKMSVAVYKQKKSIWESKHERYDNCMRNFIAGDKMEEEDKTQQTDPSTDISTSVTSCSFY